MTALRRPAAPIAEYLMALADATRLRIVFALGEGERSGAQISAELRVGRDRVSRHLVHLRRAGVVEWRRRRRLVLYRLAGPEVLAICAAACGGLDAERRPRAGTPCIPDSGKKRVVASTEPTARRIAETSFSK